MPGLEIRFGHFVEISVSSRIRNSQILKISATTNSFSTGSNEQVEYTILPPGASNIAAFFTSEICNFCKLYPAF